MILQDNYKIIMTLSLLYSLTQSRHLGHRLVRVTTTRDPGPRSVTAGVHTSVNNTHSHNRTMWDHSAFFSGVVVVDPLSHGFSDIRYSFALISNVQHRSFRSTVYPR